MALKMMVLAGAALAVVPAADAKVRTKPVEYSSGGKVFQGTLAWDDSRSGRRPGVVVIHDWMGEGPFSRKSAERLAAMGYVALAADMYGKGVRPADAGEAARESARVKGDLTVLRSRARAALDTLVKQPNVDPKRVAAIGYCFGGTVALEMARGAMPLAAVVSFHGGLAGTDRTGIRAFKGKVLVLHGADDPHVPPSEVAAFQDEMRANGVDWQFVAYGNAVHSFTNPAAGSDSSRGAAYNADADRRSWEAMTSFFRECLK